VARSTIGADDGLREELAAGWRDFYSLMVRTLLDGSEEWGRYAHDALYPKLEALESGREVMFSRSDLPPGHRLSAPGAGRPTDRLVIDEQNIVHEL
jgi:hypothetical protein